MSIFSRVSQGVIVIAALSCAPAQAQGVTEDQVLKALTPQKTRSLSIGEPAKAVATQDDAFIDSLRNKTGRALSADARGKLQAVAANKPAIDLTMEFDYGSDALRGDALRTADTLGKVLAKPEFKGQTFAIVGHTDGKGSDAVNQTLSERRAESVRRHLVAAHKIPAESLIAVGYGKSRLKNAADPLAAENRRVQAVNLLVVKTAGR